MDQSAVGSSSETPGLSSCESTETSQPLDASDESIQTPPESQTDESASKASEKAGAIRRACDLHDVDALISYATSEGGFLQDELRWVACNYYSFQIVTDRHNNDLDPGPILLQCSLEDGGHDLSGWEDQPPHQEEGQVQLDVDRSFVYYPPGQKSRTYWKAYCTAKLIEFRHRCRAL